MQCKFCLNDYPKLINAHIIPKAFFAFGSSSSQRTKSKITTNRSGVYPKNAPAGVYDSSILCADCEKTFALWDDKAIIFFQKDLKNEYQKDLELIIHDQPLYDYKSLKLFFLSVLWRAHHASHDFYRAVNLGGFHENKIKEILKCRSIDNYLEYPIIIKKFNTPRVGAQAVLAPIFSRFWGESRINIYLLIFAAHTITIKVDNRNWPKELNEIMMRSDRPLIVSMEKFEETNAYKAMINVVKINKNVKFKS